MMSRARKAFPGMVMSMLLASPAFAASGAGQHGRTDDHPAPRRTVHATDHAAADHGATNHRAADNRRAASANVSRAGGRVTTASRGRRGGRTAAVTTAFVNDATAWSERGNGVYDPGDDMNPTGRFVRGRVMQVGTASWYGGRQWQGRRMSSGERYDEGQLTAAHATLPLGSRVLVSLNGGARSVVVTITDRPGTRTRIIDLSRAAAAELGILDRGLARVALTPL